jgi:succinate-semialdehyde dehydrogenase
MLVANKVASEHWRAMPLIGRAALYVRLAATLRDRSESLAMLATSEMGKTIGAARAEIEKCAATIAWIGEHGPDILADEPVETDTRDRAYVSFLPIGTVLAVMPWNFAFWQVVRAAGPIMLSGNGFLLKHAPNVMGCAYALRDAYEASGFPKHLFAILNAGNDAVTTAIEDPRIAAVTVTGSMRAGSAVAATAGKAMKKSLLELGGADAYIVLADADIDKAVEVGIEARFQNAGQVCLAAKRFILERHILTHPN